MRSEQTGDRISLEGMRFYGYHGCLPEERARGQVFLVDVVLTLPLAAAGASDDLAATVNYAEVFALARSVVEGAPCRLIEAVAERIARGVSTGAAKGGVDSPAITKRGIPRAARPDRAWPGALRRWRIFPAACGARFRAPGL